MSGRYIYYFEKHNRQGSRLHKSVDAAVQNAVDDIKMNRVNPVRVSYLDGSIIFDTEALMEKVEEVLSERQQG